MTEDPEDRLYSQWKEREPPEVEIQDVKPGAYELSRAEYDAIDAVNFSTAKHMERSPQHYRENRVHPKPGTAAMELGQAIHVAILEPDKWTSEYVRGIEGDRRYKAVKAQWAELEAKYPHATVLRPAEYDQVSALRDAVYTAPHNAGVAAWLKAPGKYELSVIWEHEIEGAEPMLCKGRIDKYGRSPEGYIAEQDLKTCQDARPRIFGADVAKYDYDAQRAMYHDALQKVAPVDYRASVIIAVETVPPFCGCIYELGEAELAAGREKYTRWLAQLERARRTNEWPGYVQEPQALQLPKWAYPMEVI